jgi:hypothetical protein
MRCSAADRSGVLTGNTSRPHHWHGRRLYLPVEIKCRTNDGRGENGLASRFREFHPAHPFLIAWQPQKREKKTA